MTALGSGVKEFDDSRGLVFRRLPARPGSGELLSERQGLSPLRTTVPNPYHAAAPPGEVLTRRRFAFSSGRTTPSLSSNTASALR